MSNVLDHVLRAKILTSLAKAHPKGLPPSKIIEIQHPSDLNCVLHKLSEEGLVELQHVELVTGEIAISSARITDRGQLGLRTKPMHHKSATALQSPLGWSSTKSKPQ